MTQPSSVFSSRRGRRWLTLSPARPLGFLLLFLLAFLAWGRGASTVFAEPADGVRIGIVAYAPNVCNDTNELAGVTNAEAGAQLPSVQLRIMQVFVKEAESRGMSFCALSHLTRFSGVRYYVNLYPNSYQAHRLMNPPEDLLLMAEAVLLHRYPDVTEGMGHFDGDGIRIHFKP